MPDPCRAIALGLAVFPLPPGGKTPPPAGWQRAATRAPDLATWPPNANIGVGCWASGVAVLDLDVPGDGHCPRIHGAESLATACAAHGQPWPHTLTVTTPSGGQHLYFRAPDDQVIGSASGGVSPLGNGIDPRVPGPGGVAATS